MLSDVNPTTSPDLNFCPLVMVALWNRAYHYIFIVFLSSFFISSPNLSGRRLDVYHTSTHGVAVVRIKNAGLKCASRRSLQIQEAKNRHFGTIAQLCRAIISLQLRHSSAIGKNLLNADTSSTCPHNMVNFGLLTAEIGWRVWGTPANFNRFRVLALLLHRRRSTFYLLWSPYGIGQTIIFSSCFFFLSSFYFLA